MSLQKVTSRSDQIEPDLLEILCCPKCKGDLTYDAPNAEMACEHCEFQFPIESGIPVIFPFNVKEKFDQMFSRHWDPEDMAECYDRHVEGKSSTMGTYVHVGETDSTMKVLGKIQSNVRLLDAGCGTGRFFEVLPGDVCSIGVDASLNMLKIIRRKKRCNRLVCCELEHLPFKDQSFDLILSVRVIQHLKEQQKAVIEMARICRPEGEIVLHLYNSICTKGFVKWLRESRVGPVLNWPFTKLKEGLCPFGPWPLAYDKYSNAWQMKSWLKNEGLRIKEVRGTGLSFNKWLLGDFWIAAWLDRHSPRFLKSYLDFCLIIESRIGTWWPFNHLLEKFIIKAVK